MFVLVSCLESRWLVRVYEVDVFAFCMCAGRINKVQNFVCSLFDHATCHVVHIFLPDVEDHHEERGVAHTASIL